MKYTPFLVLLLGNSICYSQYIEYGEYHYKVDKPPIKKFITYDYGNVLKVVDTNQALDRYTKEVIVVDRISYYLILDFLNSNNPNNTDSVNNELYQYIKIYDNDRLSSLYKFTLRNYKDYLTNFFNYINQNACISPDDKTKIISKLKYWQ